MTLGDMLRRFREKRDLDQSQLARLTRVSPGLISAIETGRKLPSKVVTKEIIHVLKLDENSINAFLTALEHDMAHISKQVVFEFGKTLKRIIEKTQIPTNDQIKPMTSVQFAQRLGKSAQIVSFWVTGKSLPSEDGVTSIISILKEVGTRDDDIAEIKIAFLQDKLNHLYDFSFLSDQEKQKFKSCFNKCILNLKPEKVIPRDQEPRRGPIRFD
jgi:transcriptional regulator with XRE-family HTH domain